MEAKLLNYKAKQKIITELVKELTEHESLYENRNGIKNETGLF